MSDPGYPPVPPGSPSQKREQLQQGREPAGVPQSPCSAGWQRAGRLFPPSQGQGPRFFPRLPSPSSEHPRRQGQPPARRTGGAAGGL